jgi:hypothetical protein
MKLPVLTLLFFVLLLTVCYKKEPYLIEPIKAFDIDFNWGAGGPNAFARPGLWASASPADHVKWYKELGVNTIQTFCVSCNGYAWYKNGAVPEQPGLKYDFLREVTRLGHKEGISVMGYFCIGANTRWGMEHPDLSYGFPNDCHIPFTSQYLNYLDIVIRDAVTKTGIDGFMIDWIWQPTRESTGGKWLDCEKELFKELMGNPFPGESVLTDSVYIEYSRRAIDNCWRVIHKAAKETNPECIIWLSCNNPTHPHVVNSKMFKEVDWLMNEGGDLERVEQIKGMIGKNARLITCLANWNKQDAKLIVPDAIRTGVGLYGFTKPGDDSLLPSPVNYLTSPVESFTGDERNIAVLVRAYHGWSLDFVQDKK